MFQTKVTFFEGQTPAQRKAHAAHWRRQDAQRRTINNALGFWRLCGKPLCRRNRTCSCDMHACFERHWAQMPEEAKEYLRGCIQAARNTRAVDEIDRAGMAARDKYLNQMERNEAPPARHSPVEAPQPSREMRPDPDVRIRRL